MDEPEPKPQKRWRRKMVLWVLYLLVLQEIAVRAVFPVPEILNFDRLDYSPRVVEASAARCSSLAHASFRWRSTPDGAESKHDLNLYGFRDRTWRVTPRDRDRRIAVVGDSMVEGFLAEEEETIPAVVQATLRGDEEGVDIMNLGIGAADLPGYFQLIRDAIPLFEPGHVILVLYENDFQPVRFDPSWLREHMTPRRSRFWIPRLKYVIRSLKNHRFAPCRWQSKPFDFLPPIGDPRHPWANPEKARKMERFLPPEISKAVRQGGFNPYAARYMERLKTSLVRELDFGTHLSALAGFLDKYQARLWIAYLPSLLQVSDRYLDAQRQLAREDGGSFLNDRYCVQVRSLQMQCQEIGIPFLDLTPILRELESKGRVLYWAYDGHMRPEGYEAAGKAIAEWWAATRTKE
ncbi:MAG: SGNH/GDSL hydrolase family protein [Planctomycetota bacterium]|jgi:hypothetical protein